MRDTRRVPDGGMRNDRNPGPVANFSKLSLQKGRLKRGPGRFIYVTVGSSLAMAALRIVAPSMPISTRPFAPYLGRDVAHLRNLFVQPAQAKFHESPSFDSLGLGP